MFDMEFADIEPLMNTGGITEADFIDINDSLGGDSGHSYRDLHNEAQQLLLFTNSTEQCDPIANVIIDCQPKSNLSSKKSTTSKTQINKPVGHRPASRNAARERSRVKSLRCAFLDLQNSLPSVPPNTKLSKLDVLVLATTYIAHLMKILDKPIIGTAESEVNSSSSSHVSNNNDLRNFISATNTVTSTFNQNSAGKSSCRQAGLNKDRHQHRLHEKGYLHPVRKWPMRSRLYAGAIEENSTGSQIQIQTTIATHYNADYFTFDSHIPNAC
ncbi:Transcription factor 24 [Chamberlinius hualienensis]